MVGRPLNKKDDVRTRCDRWSLCSFSRLIQLIVTKEFRPLPSPALLGISGTMHDARDGFLGVSQSNTKPIDYTGLRNYNLFLRQEV
jgi:hypothetical protein